jgi:hypothetical protein
MVKTTVRHESSNDSPQEFAVSRRNIFSASPQNTRVISADRSKMDASNADHGNIYNTVRQQ